MPVFPEFISGSEELLSTHLPVFPLSHPKAEAWEAALGSLGFALPALGAASARVFAERPPPVLPFRPPGSSASGSFQEWGAHPMSLAACVTISSARRGHLPVLRCQKTVSPCRAVSRGVRGSATQDSTSLRCGRWQGGCRSEPPGVPVPGVGAGSGSGCRPAPAPPAPPVPQPCLCVVSSLSALPFWCMHFRLPRYPPVTADA